MLNALNNTKTPITPEICIISEQLTENRFFSFRSLTLGDFYRAGTADPGAKFSSGSRTVPASSSINQLINLCIYA